MSADAAAVVLAALAAPVDPGLDALLGETAAAIVRRETLSAARAWAAAVAPGRAFEASGASAAAAALGDHEGPVLLVAPDVPRLRPALAAEALADLREGAEIVVGPTTDGTPYLVAVPALDEQRAALLALGRDELFAAVAAMPGGMGMLRSERRLVSAADARAWAADPALPSELALPLAAGVDVRRRRAT